MINLLERVRYPFASQCQKHDLARNGETPDEYADRHINNMTNVELLQAIEDAMADMLTDGEFRS